MPAQNDTEFSFNFDPTDSTGYCFNIDVPLGGQALDEYKKVAASVLVQQIIENIEPEFIEQNGFEILRYPVVVFRNGADGRNKSIK